MKKYIFVMLMCVAVIGAISRKGKFLMSESKHNHHGIDYIEFAVINMEESKKFYNETFGWSFNDYGPAYSGIKKGEGEVGGFRLEDEVKTGGPLIVLYSKDLEKTASKVEEIGGKISKEIFSFPGGRRFQFIDPSGNELAVWSDK